MNKTLRRGPRRTGGRSHAHRLAALVFLAGILGATTADAIPANEVRLPPGPIDGVILAALLGDNAHPAHVTGLRLHAASIQVTQWETSMAATTDVFQFSAGPARASVYEFDDATLAFTGGGDDGFVGLYPLGAKISFVSWSDMVLSHSSRSRIASNPIPSGALGLEEPESYESIVETAHLRMTTGGNLSYKGGGVLHLSDADVRIDSSSGTVNFDNGWQGFELPMANAGSRRWLQIAATDMEIEIIAGGLWQIALSEASFHDAVITPVAQGIEFSLPLPEATATPPARTARNLLPAILVGAAIMGTGGGAAGLATYLLRRRRSPVRDPIEAWEPEECLSRVKVHIESEQWKRALEWANQAKKLAPTSARVHSTRAFLLDRLDRLEAAMEAYAEASRLDPSEGEHDVHAARLALRRGLPPGEAVALVARGLARTPGLVVEVEEDEAFGPLVGTPLFDKAMEEAWARHVRHLSSEDDEPEGD